VAIVTRYFGATAQGAGTGVGYANRAALASGTDWSSVLTGLDHTSDSHVCVIDPGEYNINQEFNTGMFSTIGPSAEFPIYMVAGDGAGGLWVPPNLGWMSAEPIWDTTGMFTILNSANTITVNNGFAYWVGSRFVSTARNGSVVSAAGGMDWFEVVQQQSNTSAAAVTQSGTVRFANGVVRCTGTAWNNIFALSSSGSVHNLRLIGNPSASSGNRTVLTLGSTTGTPRILEGLCIFGGPVDGIIISATGASNNYTLFRSVIAQNGNAGVRGATVASQTGIHDLRRNMITGNAIGIDGQSAARIRAFHNRLRNTTDFSGMGSAPHAEFNNTDAGSDADEYVDPSNADLTLRDFRIKNTSSLWGKGYGVSDQPASGGSGIIRSSGFSGGFH
jgi:hypothetical protein